MSEANEVERRVRALVNTEKDMGIELGIGGLLWTVCGLAAAGFDFAYFQDEYPTLADRDFVSDLRGAVIGGLLFGPIALIADTQHTKCKHGWRLWRKRSN